jgi:hypothetical protein
MSWLQLDEAVYRYIAGKETYHKLADEALLIHSNLVSQDLHVPFEFVELSVKQLIKEGRLAPFPYQLMTMNRANALASKHGRGVHELFKYPTPRGL